MEAKHKLEEYLNLIDLILWLNVRFVVIQFGVLLIRLASLKKTSYDQVVDFKEFLKIAKAQVFD